MIEIKNLSKAYSGIDVYKDFNLSVEEGKVTCILGESGSGKTTLLNAVAGLIDYEGSITKLKCSYVFQTPRLIPNLTVYGNLKLICKDENGIKEMLERVSLTDKADCYPISLSGGQAQRVAIARAFLYDSDVILLDEPFSSLDLKLKNQMIKLFLEMKEIYQSSALFVTHNADEAVSVADRVIVIEKGKIICDISYEDKAPRGEELSDKLRRELLKVLA